jgi:hypothetical protein
MSVLATPEYVNAGSRVVWTGQFSNLALGLVLSSVIQAVGSALLNQYNLIIEKADNNIGLTGQGSVTLYLRTDIDRGDGESDDGLTDILRNVNDAFSQQHATPNASALSNYSPASQDGSGANGTINTGTPLDTVARQNQVAAITDGGGISGWWNGLVSKAEYGSIGFVIGGLAVVGVIIYFSLKQAAP